MGHIDDLISKLLSGNITEEERRELEKWLDSPENKRSLLKIARKNKQIQKELYDLYHIDQEGPLRKFIDQHPFDQGSPTHRVSKGIRWKYAIAAGIVVIAAVVMFLVLQTSTKTGGDRQVEATSQVPNTIIPGGNKATLTLSDGSTVLLDTAADGLVAKQGEPVTG